MDYLQKLADIAQLTPQEFLICTGAVFIAGLVRGFSGFALSALIMASVVIILPPVELIPVCYVLEGAASILMARSGIKDANMPVVWGLVVGTAVGVPIGLYATTTLPVETSKLIALAVIFTLAAAQLLRASPKFLATRPGLYASGLTAGIVTGLASVGGMVVALYVLAQNAPAKSMRASLVMYLFIGMFTSLIYLLAYGVMNYLAAMRGLLLVPPVIVGVLLGAWFFRPSLEIYYKRFCLGLLIALAFAGLLKLGL